MEHREHEDDPDLPGNDFEELRIGAALLLSMSTAQEETLRNEVLQRLDTYR